MSTLKRSEIAKSIADTGIGGALHSASRKACDSRESSDLWNAINKMPDKEWERCVQWSVAAATLAVEEMLAKKGIEVELDIEQLALYEVRS